MKRFIKSTTQSSGNRYIDLVTESIQLLSEDGFDTVYVFNCDLFKNKTYIQRFDHVNNCVGTELNAKIIKDKYWDAIAEVNGNIYAYSTQCNLSLNGILLGAIPVATPDYIIKLTEKVKTKQGWYLIISGDDPYSIRVINYLWDQVKDYKKEKISKPTDSYNDFYTLDRPSVVNTMEELYLIDAFIGQVFYVCETKKRYVYTTDEMWTELCSADKPILIKVDKEIIDWEKMVPVSKLPSYVDDFPGQQTIDMIMESTTIDSVKKVEMLNDGLGLSYDQIRRIILEKIT